VGDSAETYLRVLEGVTNPEMFISLLDPGVTLDSHGSDRLWGCIDHGELVNLVRRAHVAGIRVEILNSYLVGDWMLLISRVRASQPSLATNELTGPSVGQTLWRGMSLRDGRIIHIEDFADEQSAVVALMRAGEPPVVEPTPIGDRAS
jgi:hypothetical protein